MKLPSRRTTWIGASLVLVIVGVGGPLWIGFHYWHEKEVWYVGLPGFTTALGTLALAAATFPRLASTTRRKPFQLG